MKKDIVYIEGTWSDRDENSVQVASNSVIVLFLLEYVKCEHISVYLTLPAPQSSVTNLMWKVDLENLRKTYEVEFMNKSPDVIRACCLPALHSRSRIRVVSGLCSVLRHIVKLVEQYESGIISLLGHKEQCLRTCAESSVWTKFCEVEILTLMNCADRFHESVKQSGKFEVPNEMVKLENYFKQPCVVHNINKRKRQIAKSKRHFESVKKAENETDRCNSICRKLDKLSIHTSSSQDMQELQHNYVEGPDFLLSDLILFCCISCFMNRVSVQTSALNSYLPNFCDWCKRMAFRPRVLESALNCGIHILDVSLDQCDDQFTQIVMPSNSLDLHIRDPEIKKFKVAASDVSPLVQNIEGYGLVKVSEQHPNQQLHLPWQQYPSAVHPKDGDLPLCRLKRKCEQLENLATAITHMAKPGQTIVDFCSGGGHLGILVAWLLPQCQVVLVENKVESVRRAESRIASLQLTNITIYQSNLDYFCGRFDLGTCLHACGVATDLVMQSCLDNQANFVICPCCYGNIQDTHTMQYPRSQKFSKLVNYKDYLSLGHAADQTEKSLNIAAQGKTCMEIIDSDRATVAMESGYDVVMCTMEPPSCSPKNNLLIGQKSHHKISS